MLARMMRTGSAASVGAIALLAFSFLAGAGCSRRLPTAASAPEASSHIKKAAPRTRSIPVSAQIESEVLVTLRPGADVRVLAAEYGASLADGEDWQVAALVPGEGESSDGLAGRLAGDPRVATAERNGLVETAETRQQVAAFDDGLGSPIACLGQAASSVLGVGAAQGVSIGSGVRIAILDTGAELGHPNLSGRIAGGWDFIDGDDVPEDTGDGVDNDQDGTVDEAIGHGTHVAGIAVLAAPSAELLIVRVLDADGVGDMLTIARAVRWASANGARVINLSLGGLVRCEALEVALREAEDQGIVCVAAAGNWGAPAPREFPASSPHVIGVAALGEGDTPAPFTSYGSFVAIAAPGVAIRSAFVGGGWALWSGTSMAAPFVSGGAALLLSIHPEWTKTLVLDRLGLTARKIDRLNPAYENGALGAGALDLGAALTFHGGNGEEEAGVVPGNP